LFESISDKSGDHEGTLDLQMATMEELEKSLTAKIELLKFTHEGVPKQIEKGNIKTIERLLKTIQSKIEEIHYLKVRIQELKFQQGDDVDAIRTWSDELEDRMLSFENAVINIEQTIINIKATESELAKQVEEETAKQLRDRRREEELKFEQVKLEQRLKYEKQLKPEASGSQPKERINAKLPKLVITKFKGTTSDWLRFWNQFEAEIDQTEVNQITKFSYLKELLEPKIRGLVDGLPFNSEGYERAKNILKTRFGKTSEIINAYVTELMSLPVIHGSNAGKIYEFYEKLLANVQALETLGKLGDVKGYVRMTLDKLEGIRGDLVRLDDNWQEWAFPQLIEALRKWTERNPPKLEEKLSQTQPDKFKKARSFHAKQETTVAARTCSYCESAEHKSLNCDKITTPSDRKQHLAQKQLCFNCTRPNHKASECRSQATCQNCRRKHHTSICTNNSEKTSNEKMMTATGKGSVVYPVVVVNVNGIQCRALLDTGAGSSYASAALLSRLQKRPLRRECRRIEMMMGSTTQVIELYKLTISSLQGDFQLDAEVTKVNRGVLLNLENPHYRSILSTYKHLDGVSMADTDEKAELPVHMILGTSEYAKIKTETPPKLGNPGEPIAELTRLGWTILSPGKEPDVSSMFLTQTSTTDYENLCKLDVLGLEDQLKDHHDNVYEEFKEQLVRSPEGWYETGLLWKANHPHLPNNKTGSLQRLKTLVRKLERQPMLNEYDRIIKDQLSEGIVEPAHHPPEGKEFYIPHKAIIRETAESTKVRIVYDASAREKESAPSLNECLETGPPLQNHLWSVLVRNRFHPVALAGDLKQAFLQVRIREEDRDVMRFHWLKDLQTKEVETLRFTRALFGLATSPFLLGAVIEQHLNNCKQNYPEEVKEIKQSLYVDDLITGGTTVSQVYQLKETAKTIFQQAQFELHKWHSNIPELEKTGPPVDTDQSYAKEHLGVKKGETKLLGLPWNKEKDTIQVKFQTPLTAITKRGILGNLAKIYDPLGLASPVTVAAKMLYRDACDSGATWDKELPTEQQRNWKSWEQHTPEKIEIPRSLVEFQEEIDSIELHAFGDASGKGVSSTVYAIVHQPSGDSQGLVAAKSRLAKKGLTIPRLELVAGHMSTNLVHNVNEALEGHPVTDVYSWLDSTVALHWILGNGDYKQFVNNRIRKIQEKGYIQWRHVSSGENPADLGSRGGQVDESCELWWKGPSWLSKPEEWPANIVTSPTKESQTEAKAIKQVLAVAVKTEDELDQAMQKWDFWKAIRITAWVTRFIRNCKNQRDTRKSGPLTTEETNKALHNWVKRVQNKGEYASKFQEDKLQLNLQKNNEGVYECRGRIQGDYPIYLPDGDIFTEKLVAHAHLQTLHGGVGLTMSHVRAKYWIPRLRRMARRIIRNCHGCKRFQAIALSSPPTGNLPTDRTGGSTPFQVVGVDYAGPIIYKLKNGKEGKAYILLYACSLTRALHLDLVPDQTTEEFIRRFKCFIARRGKPQKIYSDNGRTFVAAAKWLKKLRNDESFNNWLANEGIRWQFNLSRAPWWGGQFERMVGLTKQALYKSIGKGNLRWSELEEVLLDIEVALNNRPLSYVEDDVQMPLLTPSAMLFGQPSQLPEQEPDTIEDVDLRKRARYLRKCKDALWTRWQTEYLKALRERHNMKSNARETTLKPGDVMIIKSDERNRRKWKLGIVDQLFEGRDGVVRGVRLRAGKSYLERPIQHLYPLEVACDSTERRGNLNAEAPTFRPRREAAASARENIRAIARDELED